MLARNDENQGRNIMGRMLRSITAALAMLTAASASAQDKKTLEVIVFPGGFNWPIWTAQKNGYFAGNGLEVKLTPTPSSEFQLTNTYAGKFNIAMTAIDNVIAYQEGQGPVKIENPDMVAVMGGDNGFLHLVAVPEIKDVASLKGRQLSVDALSTGYAFVLRELIAKHGIKESDVTFVRAGGVRERWAALEKKEHAATMLITPFDIIAKAKGFNVLASASSGLGAYQGLVAAVTRRWAKDNEVSVVGYIKGYQQAMAWLYDRKNKADAIAILRANVPNMDERAAEASYGALLADKGGMFRDGAFDMDGIKTVLQLRSKYSEAKKELTDASKYIDTSYLKKATGR
jgi:ABC-type nitrate/sulfonate/bicarbonate transport system substrate-binding protein